MKNLWELENEILSELKQQGYEKLSTLILHLEVGDVMELEVQKIYLDRLVEDQTINLTICWDKNACVKVKLYATDSEPSKEANAKHREFMQKMGVSSVHSMGRSMINSGFYIYKNGRIVDNVWQD